MPRQLTGKVLLATHNSGKLREMRELLAPYGVAVVSAGELGLPEPDETGTTFIANAMLKAQAGAAGSGLASLADDSGLCVDALGGAPGVYTADWAGSPRDWHAAMQRVEDELAACGATTRGAQFVSTLVIAWPDGHLETFEGKVEGTLVWPPRGDKGHGFDPVFMPDGYDLTFGEMPPEQKHSWSPGKQGLSHRARAFAKFVEDALGGGVEH